MLGFGFRDLEFRAQGFGFTDLVFRVWDHFYLNHRGQDWPENGKHTEEILHRPICLVRQKS